MKKRVKKRYSLFLLLILVLLITPALKATDIDFDGETITFGSFWGFNSFIEGHEDSEPEDIEHLALIEEKFNVNIEFSDMITNAIHDAFVPSVMAGDPVADVLVMPKGRVINNFLTENILYPLDDFLDDEYFASLPVGHGELAKDYLEVAGNYHMFSVNGSHIEQRKLVGSAMHLLWNKDFFERENLPNLYELYEDGDWTWDKMLEIAEMATQDTNNDENIDQWGLSYWHPWIANPNIFSWFATNGGSVAEFIDGKVTYTLASKENVQVLTFLRELHDYVGGRNQTFFAGDSAMLMLPSGGIAGANANMSDDYGVMLMPIGPNAEENTVLGSLDVMVLPITTRRPKDLIELSNALFKLTDKYIDNMDTYIDDLLVERAMFMRDRESLNIFRDIFTNFVAEEDYSTFVPQQSIGPKVGAVVRGEENPLAALQSLEPEVQSILDDNFNRE